MKCDTCDFVCDTPLGSYCKLTNEPVEMTECHYYDEIKRQEDYEWLIKNNG